MMPRRKALDADSRSYIIAWVIRSEDDLPADFPIPEGAKNFQVGLFLPRDDSGRFGRSHYPPRVVLLQDDAMVALTHPAHDDKPARIALGDLAFCEFGHFLLIGWLRFVAAGHEIRLPYNTRCQQPVDEFLDALLRAWLGADKTDRDGGIAEFGAPLDIKFKNHLAAALLARESVRAQWFSPPSARLWGWGPFRLRSEAGGDLLAITDTRVIWIRDRWKGWYDRYGSVTSAAPLRGVESVRCLGTGEKRDLTVTLRSGVCWRIPLNPQNYGDAESFVSSAP
jgi:hypothetical protein